MKRFLLLLVATFIVFSTYAVPAYRKPFTVKQSDGTELTLLLAGDEALHYYTTIDGMPLVKEVDGNFYYATFDNGVFVSTKCLAHNGANRSAAERELLSSMDFTSMNVEIAKASGARSLAYKAAAQKAGSQIVPEGDVNIAVLLVQFKDTKFTYKKADLNNILNTKDYVYENPFANSIGSARDYFMAQSDGKFRPNFIVTDIVTLDNNMAYYGGNDSSDNDQRATYMVKEGIKKADAAGFDFSKCDNNGDGEVEFIYCIYAGYSESYGADENTVWPHQWQLSAEAGSVTVDGVKCDTYACSGELVYNESYEDRIGKTMAGIGLICHEFSHCLGLHDIYDTTYKSGNWGMDYWDVMDQGNYAAEGYVPVGYSAYQRDMCGWRELVEISSKGTYSMEPLTQNGVGYKVVNEANRNEYYILENRKQEGWDKYLFGSGMLVIHVDYLKSAWDNNTINTTKNHPRYTLIPADNELAVYGEVTNAQFTASLKGDVWPGTTGNTELTNTSTPAAKVYTGGYMNKPITDIKYENDVISFNFMRTASLDVPVVLPAIDVTSNSFVANWAAVEDATEYTIELYKQSAASDGSGDKTVLLSEDFMNCTAGNILLDYTTIDGYMSSNDWDCENVYSESGALRIGTSKNQGYLYAPWIEASGNVVTTLDAVLYNTKDTGVVLSVEYRDENTELVAYEDFDITGAGEKITFSADVDGYFYVTLHTEMSTGNKRVKIDNLNVSQGTSFKKELVSTVTTTATNYAFKNLEEGAAYLYRVKASDGVTDSAFSEYTEVALLPTGIDEIVADGDWCEIYNISGVRVYDGNKAGIPRLSKGVYVVVTASGTRKIMVE
ncbi:MAG: M6 family metalloprotease domain-containing protein [Bacteroidaceae bacterium]|nr:M6 family metalloprotease domain-containing protein [Bacteroidaceae bacterium]